MIVPIVPILGGKTRGWRVTVDGQEVKDVGLLTIEHPSFGRLTYGWTAGNYDGWAFRLAHGGVVVAPYVFIDRLLHVGVVEQVRHNQGGRVFNVPRGFCDPGEPAERAAARELEEETGLRASDGRPVELDGLPVNQDSAFFQTDEAGTGIRFFALRVPRELVEVGEAGAAGLRRREEQNAASQQKERILSVRFIPWTDAARLGDMFSVACVGRLLAQLDASGELARAVPAR